MKEISRKILEMAALGGPFFSRQNLQVWVGRISPIMIEDALKEGVAEFFLVPFSSNHYYFKSKVKYTQFLGATTQEQRKRFLRDRIQAVLDQKKEPFDILAVMAMQLDAREEAADFWIKAAIAYCEYSAWYPAGQAIGNAKLIFPDQTRTEELKRLESAYRVLLTEFGFLDPLQSRFRQKAEKLTFPVKVAGNIDLSVVKPEEKVVPELNEMEKAYIQHTLDSVGGNKTKAAKLLGINRTTLIMRMKKSGMM